MGGDEGGGLRNRFLANGVIYGATADGGDLYIHADGLRNPFALCFSLDGRLFAVDQATPPGWRGNGGFVSSIWQVHDIILREETINIFLYRKNYAVQVDYVFVNTGAAQEINMGFPNLEGYEPIQDFAAYAGDKKLPVTSQAAGKKEITGAENRYECFTVPFTEKEVKHIRNTYVYDNDPCTARVEGVPDPGIGESITVDMTPYAYGMRPGRQG